MVIVKDIAVFINLLEVGTKAVVDNLYTGVN